MRKILFLMMALVLPMVASAQVEIDGFFFNLNAEDHTAEVTKAPFGYYRGDLVIPETVTSDDVEYRVTSIGEHAFQTCQSLTSISIPDNVTEIKVCAFYHCYYLTSVKIGNGVISIAPQAFYACIALTSVTLGNNLERIESEAFCRCRELIDIDIPASVKSIGMLAFQGCEKLESCTGGSGLTIIGSHAFYECRSLKSFSIPEGVTTIEEQTFNECTSMESIHIHGGVTKIGDYAFIHCRSLKSLFIPRSVTSIGMNAFVSCCNLESIEVEKGNPTYDSRDNCNAIIREVTNLTTYLVAGCKNTVIPSTVTIISGSAFWAQSELTSIVIPSNVKKIESGAFLGCDKLASITLPSTHVPMDDGAFGYGNDDTPPVTIRCLSKDPRDISQSAFSDYLYEHATLVVPNGTVGKYQACEGWKKFAKIIEQSQTAVKSITTDQPSVQENYTLDGKQSTAFQRGLNIVRMSDGSVKKVLMW